MHAYQKPIPSISMQLNAVIAHQLVHFVSICIIHKCQLGIGFKLLGVRTVLFQFYD